MPASPHLADQAPLDEEWRLRRELAAVYRLVAHGYHDYEGVALNLAEQRRLVADLADHPALILRNHGLLTVGETPGEAFLRMYYLDKACEIQTTAMAGGAKLTTPHPDICELTARQLSGEDHGSDFTDDQVYTLAWSALLRLVERVAPDYRD
ncbi:class II aldolase/adducin family protein [Streptomyces asiaticus]|uniref:class II aldolase/adducin family protein n=1 Tax=Streptomyces asiaticus TaxID=114695 RepID=UPI00381264A6